MFTIIPLCFFVTTLLTTANAYTADSGNDAEQNVVECLGIKNTCKIRSLNFDLFSPGMVAGSVSIVPSDVLNDTAFVVLKFGDETIDNLEFGTRTIYGMNSNFINPEGIPLPKNVESKLVIHKDFAGQWATERDKHYYNTVKSGESMTVYLSIMNLVADPTDKVEAYDITTLACAMFSLVKP